MSKKHSDLQAKHMPWQQPQRIKVHYVKNANFLGAWHDIGSGKTGERHQRAQRISEIEAERRKREVEPADQPNVEETAEVQDEPKSRTPVRYQMPVDDITKD